MSRPDFALFVFLDGIGLGPGSTDNPFATARWPTLRRLANGQDWTQDAQSVRSRAHVFLPLDAALDLPGLPQSGTGQATLYTGVNAARLAGRHYGPHAPTAAHAVLASHGLWARLLATGVVPEQLAFATAYPARFFEYGERSNRWPTAARMTRASPGVRLRDESDVMQGLALTAEITGEAWRDRLGLNVPVYDPAVAGRLLAGLAASHTVTLYEHYDTDTAGHSREADRARSVLDCIDRFLGGLLDAFDASRGLLVLTSDHGNLEDLSVKTHTRHPVPLVAWGHRADAFADCRSLLDVTPTLVAVMTGALDPA